jgi:hypothetical protein
VLGWLVVLGKLHSVAISGGGIVRMLVSVLAAVMQIVSRSKPYQLVWLLDALDELFV